MGRTLKLCGPFICKPHKNTGLTMQELTSLFENVPAQALSKTIDDVMIEYAITSIKDEQGQTADVAINHIRNMKQLRDVLNKVKTSAAGNN
jgi:hypothetical protein